MSVTAFSPEIPLRQQEILRLEQTWKGAIMNRLETAILNSIPGKKGRTERLFYSGYDQDENRNGLRSVTFADHDRGDDLWAFINKKYGCCLMFSFETNKRAKTEKGYLEMQYDKRNQVLTFKDAYRVVGQGAEEDRLEHIPDNRVFHEADRWLRSWLS